jgi:hypothetical protein
MTLKIQVDFINIANLIATIKSQYEKFGQLHMLGVPGFRGSKVKGDR